MSPSLPELKVILSGLPTAERAELAEFLLRSLDPDSEEADAEWVALAEQRMAEVLAGQVAGVPAEEVLNSLPGTGQRHLQEILEAARKRIRAGEGIPEEQFWDEVKAEARADKGKTRGQNLA